MYGLVMKMDDDTAQVFCQVMASDLFEQEIENNLGTLQRHLNEVVAKRHADPTSRPSPRTPTTHRQSSTGDALEENTKATRTPQYYGYQWEKNDFRRDPSTGRFMVKIKRTMTLARCPKQADKMIGDSDRDITDAKRRAPSTRTEYRQVAAFLETASDGQWWQGQRGHRLPLRGQGRQRLHLDQQLRQGGQGPAQGSEHYVAGHRRPSGPTLTTGGAAYGLASAMGHQLSPDQVRRANLGDDEVQGVQPELSPNAGTAEQTTSRMYQRLSSTGSAMNTLGAPE